MTAFKIASAFSHSHIRARTWLMLAFLSMVISFTPLALADIFAQSGYGPEQDGVLLFTEKCPSDKSGELQTAVARTGNKVYEGCYVINNRGNAIVKWNDGSIQELNWQIFGNKPLKFASPPVGKNGFSDWEFFNGKTSLNTPLCGLFTANSDKKNIRNVAVKQLANRESMNVTLYNDKWAFNSGAKMNIVLDFADNQPLTLPAYADGKMLDITLPKETTFIFLSLLSDQKQIRFKLESPKEKFWSVPLTNMKAPLKQFLDCAREKKN